MVVLKEKTITYACFRFASTMSQASEQMAFEGYLNDLERLDTLKSNSRDLNYKIFKDFVSAKVQSLAETCIHKSESTTVKDIERLLALRFSLPRYGSYSAKSGFSGHSCIDHILDSKIYGLLNSGDKKLDLEPIESLQRLGLIRRNLAKTPSGYQNYGAEITTIIQKRSLDLGERIASLKVAATDLSNLPDLAPSAYHHTTGEEKKHSDVSVLPLIQSWPRC